MAGLLLSEPGMFTSGPDAGKISKCDKKLTVSSSGAVIG